MAIKSTNNEWLCAVNSRKPSGKHGKRNKKLSVTRSPSKESCFIELPSRRNTALHQTRVSSFFKKKSKRKLEDSGNDDICIIESPAKEIVEEHAFSTTWLGNQSSIDNEITYDKEALFREIPYDEEALFGPCGDSVNETTVERICDDSDDDSHKKTLTTGVNDIQLSPCIISKYRTFSNSASRGETSRKLKNKNCQPYFKPIEHNILIGNVKKTCIKKLSLKKHKHEDLYVTTVSPRFDYDTENNSELPLCDNSLSCIEPPSPIVFSDQVMGCSVDSVDEHVQESTEKLLNYSEDIKEDDENSADVSTASLFDLTEENASSKPGSQTSMCEGGIEDILLDRNSISDAKISGSDDSCYLPPSPIHFTESLM